MKKKAIALLLSIAIITVTGCGKTEPTSNEVEVESTTVEEVTTEEVTETEVVEESTVEEVTTEEVVEEVNPEEFPVIEGKTSLLDSYMAMSETSYIIQCTETDYVTGEQKYIEYLFNIADRVFACIDEENLFYSDFKGKETVAYVQNEDNTGFIKVTDDKEANSMTNAALSNTLEGWFGQDTDWIFTEGSDEINGEYIYAYQRFQNEEGTESYKVSFFINKETNLPFMQVISTTMPSESITVETDEALITGEEPVVREARFVYSYPVEGTEDFETFKAATTLPTDEECVTAE